MERRGLQVVDSGALQFSPHARQHFRGGIVGISEGKNFVRAGVPFADEVGHALREHGGFPGAGASDDQHRAIDMLDGLPLTLIGNDLSGR